MTTLNGVRDAEYLAQFLGKKIAVRDAQNPNRYFLYPELVSIHSNKLAHVKTRDGIELIFSWDYLENPYIVLTDAEVIVK